jgi:hypothetical protein
VAKSPKQIRLEMWFNGENELFEVQFIWDNVLVKVMTISVQNCKIMPSSDLPFAEIFLFNKPNLFNFYRNVVQFHHNSKGNF